MDDVKRIAKMIDHSLLSPSLTDEGAREGCRLARRLDLASVCVKPYAVPIAVEELAESDVAVGTVIGFPHGNSTIETKVFETEQAIASGAAEIDMVVNIGKVLGEDWDYLENEVTTVAEACHARGALLKVIFENDLLPDDKLKIRLCEICSRAGADWVKTSTGYNYVKGSDGKYSYRGATDHDLKLMREHAAPAVQVKAAGGVGSLDAILRVREYGVTRIGTGQSANIIEDAKRHFGQ